MAQVLTLCDEYGIIYQAMKILPNEHLKLKFLKALAELEDSDCHKTRKFPETRLHKIKGVKRAIYRADIDKISGWRIHVQYINGQIHLKNVGRDVACNVPTDGIRVSRINQQDLIFLGASWYDNKSRFKFYY